jgi:small subunit ribosomal protein S6
MKKQYECLFIIDNAVKEDDRNKIVDKFAKMAGADTKIDKWGLRKFVTPINHKKDGYYYLLNFVTEPNVPKMMGDLMNITEGLQRFMFVCIDDQKAAGSKPKKNKKEKIKGE